MDRREAVSELERVAILLDATASAIEIEDPAYGPAVAPMRRAATELRLSIATLAELWAEVEP